MSDTYIAKRPPNVCVAQGHLTKTSSARARARSRRRWHGHENKSPVSAAIACVARNIEPRVAQTGCRTQGS
jgi:hypothetical protein